MIDVVALERAGREADLLTSHAGVFRFEDRAKIMELAFAREDAGEAWVDIVRSFHSDQPRYWGFSTVPYGHKSSKRPKTEAEIRSKDVIIFLWTALQSLVIIKGFIMYFGLNYAIEHEDWYGGADTGFYGWGLAITLVISFGGLILFAVRKSRGREWD